MKATEIIKKLQEIVNEHGDFDLKIGYMDDDFSYDEHLQPEDFNITIDWDERDNDWHGGWLNVERTYDECDCMYDGMDYNDYEIEEVLRDMEG